MIICGTFTPNFGGIFFIYSTHRFLYDERLVWEKPDKEVTDAEGFVSG